MKVVEIFKSLQGEGLFTGSPAIFIRLAGCNLHCPFCDTDHHLRREMTEREIGEACAALLPASIAVLTGGEPGLQINEKLVDVLHSLGLRIHVETNGTIDFSSLPLDHVTLSPKQGGEVKLSRFNEIKVLMLSEEYDPSGYDFLCCCNRFLQPCHTGNPQKDAKILHAAVEYVKSHPQWRLSLQTHKLINIP